MTRSSRRTTRADVRRMLAADLTSVDPPAAEVRRLAMFAAAAPPPAGSPLPWWRHGTAVAVFGATLTAGVGASYAAGVVDAPWTPSQERPEHIVPQLPSTPPTSGFTDDAGRGPESEDPSTGLVPSGVATPGRPDEPGQPSEQGGRSDEAPGQTGTLPPTATPPETTPGQGTGKGRGHGPGGNPDHAEESGAGFAEDAGRPDDPGINIHPGDRGSQPIRPDTTVREDKPDRV